MVNSKNLSERSVRVLNDDCYEMSDWADVMCGQFSYLQKEYTKERIDSFPLTNILTIDENMDVTGGDVIILSSTYRHDRDNYVIDNICRLAEGLAKEKQLQKSKKCILYFDFENSSNFIGKKYVYRSNSLSWRVSANSWSSEKIMYVASWLRKASNFPIYLSDCIGKFPSAEFISECMFKFYREHKETVELVVIEELDSFISGNNDNYYSIIKQIKRIAKCFNVPILILAQLKFDADINDDEQIVNNIIELKRNILPVDKIILMNYTYWNYPNRPLQYSDETDENFRKREKIWEQKKYDAEHSYELIVAQGNCISEGAFFRIQVSYDSEKETFGDIYQHETTEDEDIPF